MDCLRVDDNILALHTPLRVHLFKLTDKRLHLWKTLVFPDCFERLWKLENNQIIACIKSAVISDGTYVELDIVTEQLTKRKLPIANFKVSRPLLS